MANWTRLIRFVAVETGRIHIGEPIDSALDVGLEVLEKRSVKAYEIKAAPELEGLDPNAKVDRNTVLTVAKLLTPIAPQATGVVRGIGLNYYDHAEETKNAVPTVPTLFYKPTSTLISPGEPIIIPRVAQPVEKNLPDYEAELAIIIGSEPVRDVSEADALKYVLGYTAANDVSFRYHQLTGTSQWGFSKSFDQTNPLGPVLVSAKALKDPQTVRLTTTLNGTVLQDGNTANQIFGVAKVISFLSQGTTLLPGSLIITGTPKGVGYVRKTPITLKHGDDVRIFLGSGIGTLVNPVEEEGKGPIRPKL